MPTKRAIKHREGARVDAMFDGMWYPGMVEKVIIKPGEATRYMILFDDGDTNVVHSLSSLFIRCPLRSSLRGVSMLTAANTWL
jgi:hypothetical protein